MELNGYRVRSETIASLRSRPLVIADVGAAGGVNPRYNNNLTRVIAFEPDEKGFAEATAAAAPNLTLLPDALWSESATKPLYITRSRRCCSLYPPNAAFIEEFNATRFEVEHTIEMKCRSLSQALGERDLADIDFIKLDTQGSELDIMRGGEDILRDHATGLEVEAEFLELYQGQPLFGDIHAYLSGLGFRLVDIRPSFYAPRQHPRGEDRTGFVGFVDARYFKPANVIADMLAKTKDPLAKLHRTIYSYALHGHTSLIAPAIKAALPLTGWRG